MVGVMKRQTGYARGTLSKCYSDKGLAKSVFRDRTTTSMLVRVLEPDTQLLYKKGVYAIPTK